MDRKNRAGGGVAACFKDGLQTQELEVAVPHLMEALFFRVVLADNSGLLLCVMYRPPRQGRAPLDFLTEELDTLLQRHKCSHVMIVGDLNFHMEQDAFSNLLTVQALTNHVTFPTHERGGLLDPVVTDLPEASISCQQLGPVGSSDHFAVLSQVELQTAREDAIPRTVWLWNRADWPSMKQDMENTDWESLLMGDAETKARTLTTRLLALQQQHVPSQVYLSRPGDPAWFGFRCRASAEAKHAAWVRYKRHPSRRNKTLHREACKRMTSICRWARNQLREDRRRKLSGPGVGNKTWWNLVKEQQGACHRETLPPLTRPDGSTATSSADKATLLAELFANKMKVDDSARPVPQLAPETDCTVTTVLVTAEQVERLLGAVDVGKATGPDDVSPRLLKHCARELSAPLTTVFTSCLREKKWPSVWKEARVVPVHKKNSRSEPNNYRPISLLSVMGKLLEKIVAAAIYQHLSENHLLSDRQFGFRPGRSTADLLLIISKDWQDALEEGLDTLVVALDIAGAFDRVWHAGLVKKLCAKGIQGNLLALLEDYLQGRTLRVVINGQASQPLPIQASVPQGSVLGPILWNIYIDDLLRQIPTLLAYADDCSLSRSYCRSDSQRAVRELNRQLRLVMEWGEAWQVSFAPEKTQAMVISRSPAASPAVSGCLFFGDQTLPLQEHVKLLGVTVDCGLRFDRHVAAVAHQVSQRVSALRRMSGNLDSRGILTLYKAQIRPCMEYSALSWMSSAPTHLQRLDAVQRRALRLVGMNGQQQQQQEEEESSSLLANSQKETPGSVEDDVDAAKEREMKDKQFITYVDEVGKKVWLCKVCDRSFGQSSNLYCHLRMHTGDKPYHCNVCPRAFRQISHLKDHMRRHTGAKPHRCSRCRKCFSQRSAVRRHIRVLHGGDAVALREPESGLTKEIIDTLSDECGLVSRGVKMGDSQASTDRLLENDEQLCKLPHKENIPHACRVCQKQFSQVSSFNAHTRKCRKLQTPQKVAAADNRSCEWGKSFAAQLLRHQEGCSLVQDDNDLENKTEKISRSGEECESDLKKSHCENTGDTENKKSRHKPAKAASINTLVTQNQFKCKECGEVLHGMTSYKAHLQAHGEELQQVCVVCGEAFKRASALRYHQSMKHGRQDRRYKDFCSIGYATVQEDDPEEDSVTVKVETESEESLSITDEDEREEEYGGREPYTRMKPRKTYLNRKSRQDLKRTRRDALKTTSNTTQKDIENDKEFNESSGENLESKSYVCSVCGMTFTRSSKLRHHIAMWCRGRHSTRNNTNRRQPRTERTPVKVSKVARKPENQRSKSAGNSPVACSTPDSLSERLVSKSNGDVPATSAVVKEGSVKQSSAALYCKTCDTCFPDKDSCDKHVCSPASEKPFRCEHCLLRFRRKAHLFNHYRRHTREASLEDL
uniref:Uncharacterized protein n=1 Tax=Scylla olivacea TaxID=85551 RepID=A0A0P4VX79_SCYOL